MQARGPLQPTSAAPSHGGMDPIAAGRVSVGAATRRCSQGETLRVGEGTHPLTPSNSIRRFLGACCEVTLQREECEKPWCLTDNALPCDTPQLAAGRLHCLNPPLFHRIFNSTPHVRLKPKGVKQGARRPSS